MFFFSWLRKRPLGFVPAVFFYLESMSHKQKTENQVGFAAPPPTAASTQLQTMAQTPADFSTPIHNAYGRAEQQLGQSYNSPLGAYTTADVRDKSLREQKQGLEQNMGLDLAQAAQQSSQDAFNRQYQVAGLTAPQFYNTGGTTTSGGSLDTLGLVASAGSGALA